MELEAFVGCNRIAHRLRDGNGCGFGLTAEAGGKINGAADCRIIEVLRRSDIADHGASGVNADTKAPDIFKVGGVFHVRDVDDAERAEAALKNHVGALEDRHHAVATEFVDVAAVLVNEIDLLGQQRADQGK